MNSNMNNRKFIGLTLLLILLPTILIGWLTLRISHQNESIQNVQYQQLVEQYLKRQADDIRGYFEALRLVAAQEGQFISAFSRENRWDVSALRNAVQQRRYIQNVYIANRQGARQFPPLDHPTSAEQLFLQRTQALWSDRSRFSVFFPESEGGKANRQAQWQSLSSNKFDFVKDSDELTLNWQVWYADEGSRFILWAEDSMANLIVFELDAARVMSDLINRLPITMEEDWFQEARVVLKNEQDQVFYQWGGYEPPLGSEMVSFPMMLNVPLGGWSLNYHSEGPWLDERVAYTLWLVSVMVVLLLCLFGFIGYREQKRQWQLAQQRVSFVNQVSHELKTPLTNIRMYSEMLESALDEADDRSHRYARVIASESQRLSRLIENVLSFSRAQNQKLTLNKRLCDVARLVDTLVDHYRPILANRNMQVEYQSVIENEYFVDAEIIEQVLINLISNAEKYAAEGGVVRLHVSFQAPYLDFEVCDHGPGIPKGLQERVFEPFYRISSRLTDGVSGTGIGLNIARQLARLHGGDVYVKSSAEGCCFCFRVSTES